MIGVNTKEKKVTGDVYEIHRNCVTMLQSQIPLCGYSVKMLKKILADGHRYYVNGKMVRKIEEG